MLKGRLLLFVREMSLTEVYASAISATLSKRSSKIVQRPHDLGARFGFVVPLVYAFTTRPSSVISESTMQPISMRSLKKAPTSVKMPGNWSCRCSFGGECERDSSGGS